MEHLVSHFCAATQAADLLAIEHDFGSASDILGYLVWLEDERNGTRANKKRPVILCFRLRALRSNDIVPQFRLQLLLCLRRDPLERETDHRKRVIKRHLFVPASVKVKRHDDGERVRAAKVLPEYYMGTRDITIEICLRYAPIQF